jgi:predicted SAM-dependent methyltransferase
MSETSKTRHLIVHLCQGNGVDLGSGGDPIVPHAIQFERGRQSHLSTLPIQWVSDTALLNLPFKDQTLDFVYASHILEDFYEWTPILKEWARVVKKGGAMIIQVPDHERFRKVVAAGQPDNLAHKHESFPGELTRYFNQALSEWRVVMDRFEPEDSYNVLFVANRIL